MQLTFILSFYLSLKNTSHADRAFYNSSFWTTLWSGREGRQIGILISLGLCPFLSLGYFQKDTYLFMGTLGPAQKVPLGKFLISNLVISVYWVATVCLSWGGGRPARFGTALCCMCFCVLLHAVLLSLTCCWGHFCSVYCSLALLKRYSTIHTKGTGWWILVIVCKSCNRPHKQEPTVSLP